MDLNAARYSSHPRFHRAGARTFASLARIGVYLPARRGVVTAACLAAIGLTLVASGRSEARAAEPCRLRVMTYNLRYASDRGPNAWSDRRPVAAAMIRQTRPDVWGTQEGLYRQLKDLAADLPEYEWIGLGRDGGSRGEFMAIFFCRERFEPVEFDHFWLSDTPEVVASSTWGNSNRRMVTWVKLRERASGQMFYVVNTHFDHEIQVAREKSAALVVERLKKLDEKTPLVLLGDFNAAAEANPVYARLVESGLVDSWNSAAKRGEAVGTFHDFRGPRPGGQRIDWILMRGAITSAASEVVTFEQNGQYPSDHFPVWADLALTASNP